jgi:hypothetical protein
VRSLENAREGLVVGQAMPFSLSFSFCSDLTARDSAKVAKKEPLNLVISFKSISF